MGQHFLEEIRSRWGHHIQDHNCELCDDLIDVTLKNVGEAEKWIHLGHKHGKTNEILQEMGRTQIIIKDRKDVSYIQTAEPVIETKILEPVNNPEVFQSSEDEISTSPPQPEPEVFSCQLCDKTTKNQTLLDLHLIAIHFKKEILQNYGNAENTCELCTKAFPNADGFAFHLGQEHDLLRLIMQRRAKKIAAEKAAVQGHSGYLKSIKCHQKHQKSKLQHQNLKIHPYFLASNAEQGEEAKKSCTGIIVYNISQKS